MNWIIPKILEDLENELDGKDVKYYYFGIPDNISDDILRYGVICVVPVSEDITPIATGLTDLDNNTIEIVLGIQAKSKFYKNAQTDSAVELLNKIMSGKDGSGVLLSNTIRYIVRTHMRDYGIRQFSMSIKYDDDRIPNKAVATATMTISQENIEQQPI